jgi:hypothetical protein
MIKDTDIVFHTPDLVGYDWAETGYFPFYIGEANIMGWVYIVHRPGVGATVADIEIIDRWSPHVYDARYINMTQHNPLPERAESFSLPNGLQFLAKSIREYELHYAAGDVSLTLSVSGIMEPYDIHDRAMDPMAAGDAAAAAANSGFGTAYSAHFDMTARAVGVLRTAGGEFPIDCITTMDHSWGPRPETGIHPILWTNAHFHEGYALHGIFAYNKDAEKGQQHSFKHGYALVDGKVFGAVAGRMTVEREGFYPRWAEMRITDLDGREHIVAGDMITHHPWMPYSNNLGPTALVRWRQAGRPDGYGPFLEGLPLNHQSR